MFNYGYRKFISIFASNTLSLLYTRVIKEELMIDVTTNDFDKMCVFVDERSNSAERLTGRM